MTGRELADIVDRRKLDFVPREKRDCANAAKLIL